MNRSSTPDLDERIARLSPAKRALLERRLRERGAEALRSDTVPRRGQQETAPLSFSQQRLWFLDQLEPGSVAYNVPRRHRFLGRLDRFALERTLEEIVRRHEVLRTTFETVNGEPVQLIAPPRALALDSTDLTSLSRADREAEAIRIARQEEQAPFDLARGPLLRARLIRLAAEEHILLITNHHIVSDAWSGSVLLEELEALYEAFSIGKPSPLPPLPIQYADFARWQREWLSGQVLEEQVSYWSKQLAELSVVQLPTDRPRPPAQSFRGMRHSTFFSRMLAEGLKELSRREGATLYMTLLAAFHALLSRYTAQEDIAVGSPIAGRTQVETEGLIGCFVNILVLRGDLSGDPTFRQLLARVRESALQAYAHQHLPFEKLVEELQPERDLGANPLFQVLFALQNAPRASFELTGLKVVPFPVESESTHLDLEVYVWEKAGGLNCTFVYATDLFDSGTIARMMGHYQRLLEEIVADAGRRVSQLPLLTHGERRQVLEEWNQTAREYPREATVHGLFEQQVKRAPNAEAVVFGDERLTYGQLNERANRLARYLGKLGVGPEILVGLCVERSLEMVVGLLGILKAGGAYVPLDPNYPRQRLAFMLEDSAAPVVLTQQSLLEALPEGSFERVRLDEDWPEIAQEESENPASQATAENLAYAIYTSGSTGRPKGVLIRHRSVANLFAATQPALGFDRTDVWTVFHSYAFDLSAWEIWGALLHGGRLVIVPPELTQSPVGFAQLLARESVTVASLTPAAARQLAAVRGDPAAGAAEWKLRLLICGGEALPAELAAELLSWDVPLWNFYGPTEATVWTSIKRVEPSDCRGPTVPIGRPIANTQAYVLDRHREPVPLGVPGELYIGGEGLARGYLRRTELDREKFIPHPFKREPGARLYATGDRARLLPDGTLEFLGRLDHQVKIRGYRVELGEIEAAISQHAGVREAVAVVRQDTPVESRLVAYLVVDRDREPAVAQLRTFIRASLPDYMVPSAFVFLDALPLTPNGKIDRRALPAPDGKRPEGEPFTAPRTPVESALAEIWKEILRVDRVGVQDNFFELGGHSLLATQLVSRVADSFGLRMPLRRVFEEPVLEGLSLAIAQSLAEREQPDEMLQMLADVRGLSDEEAQSRLISEGHADEGGAASRPS